MNERERGISRYLHSTREKDREKERRSFIITKENRKRVIGSRRKITRKTVEGSYAY